MSTNDPYNQPHPEELLYAYALNALDEDDEFQVETHLEGCAQCRLAVAGLLQTAARLGQSVGQLQAPRNLQLRLMQALEPADPGAVPFAVPVAVPVKETPKEAWFRTPLFRFLMPTAAAVMVGLFAGALVMNIRLADRTETLEQDNSTLTAQVAQSAEEESQMAETVHQLQSTNYWLANPENSPMTLKPPNGAGNSRGIILLSADGRRAMLLLAGMRDPASSSTYQVWLVRQGDKQWAGAVTVDDGGWGTTTLQPRESLFGFDKVSLTAERLGVRPGTDMVLEGNIPTPVPPQMLIIQ